MNNRWKLIFAVFRAKREMCISGPIRAVAKATPNSFFATVSFDYRELCRYRSEMERYVQAVRFYSTCWMLVVCVKMRQQPGGSPRHRLGRIE
jgi:hypothetical protein